MNWYKNSQTQLSLPGANWNLQPSLPGADWQKAKEPIQNTQLEYDDFKEEFEETDTWGLFRIRRLAEKYGYDVDVVNFKNGPVAVISTRGKIEYVIDDLDSPSLEKPQEWIDNIQDWSLEEYVNVPDKNEEFWSGVGRGFKVYHGTAEERIDDIMASGLQPRAETRGLTNRWDTLGVFTSAEYETASYYYDVVLEIDVGAMKADGYMPHIRGEEPLDEAEIRSSIAHAIGYDEYYRSEENNSDGLAEDTIVFEGVIPAKYLRVLRKDD